MENFPSWLTKQMIKGVRKFNLDAYLLALEGWRRGLTLTWYYDMPKEAALELVGFNPIAKSFSLASREKKHFFYRSRGDMVSNQAVKVAGDKQLTKQFLNERNILTPQGRGFSREHSLEDILEYIKGLEFPIVIKPSLGSLGNGVFTNIYTYEEAKRAVDTIRNELDYEDILVEEHIEGKEYRVYKVGEEVVACTLKKKPHIIGNGIDSIQTLIEEKNRYRKENPHLSQKLIKIDDNLISFLKKKSQSLDTVLKDGEFCLLGEVANTSVGGESHNLTQSAVPHEIKKVVSVLSRKFPEMPHGGIDLILRDNKPYIIEMNSTASYAQHIFPYQGEPINVCAKIIDFYFPESIESNINERAYFNYKKIREILKDRLVDRVEITSLRNNNELSVKRYIVKGKVQGVGYREWARRHASKFRINGYVKNLKNGSVVIIAWSNNEGNFKTFEEGLWEGPKRSKVSQVNELTWDKQLNIGFEIKK